MKSRMKNLVAAGLTAVMTVGLLAGCGAAGDTKSDSSKSEGKKELTYYCIPDAAKVVDKKVKLFNEEYPDVKVNVVELPNDASERLTTISTVLQSKDASLDVFDMDVTWPQMFNESGWLSSLDDVLTEEEVKEFYPSAIEANTYKDEIYSLPLYVDAGMLFYRSDLLEKYGYEAPKTWHDVTKISKEIMEKEEGITAGFSSSWKQFEGLTCCSLELIWAYGGDMIDENKEVVIDSKEAKAGLEQLNKMANVDKITAEGITSFTVTDARVPFYSGNCVFLRDWSSAYVGAQDEENSSVAGKVAFTPMPLGSDAGTNNSCLGGWGVGVSAFSENQEEAKAFVKYLTGYEAQKMEAITNAKMPSRPAVLEDAKVKEAVPYLAEMVTISELTKSRPMSAYYAEISSAVQTEVSSLLSGGTDVDAACANMKTQIEEIANR